MHPPRHVLIAAELLEFVGQAAVLGIENGLGPDRMTYSDRATAHLGLGRSRWRPKFCQHQPSAERVAS